MFRKLLLVVVLGALALPLVPGCSTKEPVLWSSAHNRRHALTIIDGFEETWSAIDHVVFGLEDYPYDNVGQRFLAELETIPYGLHRFHMEFDSMLLDVPEYPLEAQH